jgi:hypothetical protein
VFQVHAIGWLDRRGFAARLKRARVFETISRSDGCGDPLSSVIY